jgi:acetoin utilization deacetylase AcuC-like enzyme
VWPRWSELAGHGPEVWPNYFPYVNGSHEHARGPCPTQSLVGQVGWYLGDLSAPIGQQTWLSAWRSASTAVAAADAVRSNGGPAYALCRPSGHHARADRAAGACYLNNAAIAARRLQTRYGRVAILDVDVHHGDGTQHIFYACEDVLTVSVHANPASAYPFYSGYAHEVGHGPGTGFNLNLPLELGADSGAFQKAVETAAAAITAFAPDALVLALGFDGHHHDPTQLMKLDSSDYALVGRVARALGLPVLVVQEGGYAVDVIGECLAAALEPLTGWTEPLQRPASTEQQGEP